MKKYLVLFLIIISNSVCAMQNEQNQMIQFPSKEVVKKELDSLPLNIHPFIEYARLVDFFADTKMPYFGVGTIIGLTVNEYNRQRGYFELSGTKMHIIRANILQTASTLVLTNGADADGLLGLQFPSKSRMIEKLHNNLMRDIKFFVEQAKLVDMFADKQMSYSEVTPIIERAADEYNQQRHQFQVSGTNKYVIIEKILRLALMPKVDTSVIQMWKFPSEEVLRKRLYELPLYLQPFIELAKLVDIFANKEITNFGVRTIIELARKEYNDQYSAYQLSTVDVSYVYKAVLSSANVFSKAKL